jgi:folate-binding protein YgfZ
MTSLVDSHTPNPSDTAHELSALLRSAGIFSLDDIGWISVTGSDRVRWLNGMATNSIQQLQPGEGAYSFFLNAQGRIQGDGYIFSQTDALSIETGRAQIEHLLPFLDRFIIMDDVELKDVASEWSGIEIAGPAAASKLQQIDISVENLDPLRMRSLPHDGSVNIIHAYSPLTPRYELWGEKSAIDPLRKALEDLQVPVCGEESRDQLRMLEGTPRFGVDIRDRELPQETNQTRALHFNKGCYLGQEIVERIRSRGNVHRTFHAFRLEGAFPAPGAVLESQGASVGVLTSVVSPAGFGSLGLGYIRREVLDRDEPIQYPGGTAVPVATPIRADEAAAS